MGVIYMAASNKSKLNKKKRQKRIKRMRLFFCIFLLLVVSIVGGYKIASNISRKDVKVLGTQVNENKNENGNNIAESTADKNKVKNNEINEANMQNKPNENNKAENTKNINENEKATNKADASYNGEKEPSKPASSNSSYAVNVEEVFKKDGKKTAFLTFDDGPSRDVTPKILSILDKYNIKATFFVTGEMAQENKELLMQEYKSGQAIGNHSYSHNYKKVYSGVEGFKQEFDTTNNILKSILGDNFNSRLFRFPGGSFEKYKNPYKDFLKSKGYVYIDWNALNGDAEGIGFTAERLINRFKSTAAGQEDLVILMHDAGGKKSTAEALPTIIEYLKAQGYEFKVLK